MGLSHIPMIMFKYDYWLNAIMSDPKKKRKKTYKIETPGEARELYLRYMEGIFFEELRDGVGINIDY